ncbi:hypothetical protein HUE87_09480 [Candidatus Sulfurimonas marisnigri]|uniref:Lipoprotein n=1 Tax=Candidatus Sulfurimonas marisnigri TaxID=2740405 RepID=A0A7S7LZ42_9BACT|nr:hypothetical protein [Candidatus Sulfurimonas marisnigri]QOY54107.1 hypothetical protein HUE87_09480 [Candidatus Sulfurimonas marisnigri]
MKYIIKTISLLLSIVLFSGCVTKSLWEDKHTYYESVQSFNLAEDKLIIIGKEYHYIFTIDNKIKKLLMSKNKEGISFETGTFHIDKENKVEGNVYINYQEKEQLDYLKSLGFSQNKKTNEFKLELEGTRYLPKHDFHFEGTFSKEYKIKFLEKYSKYNRTTQILLSPLTVATDGVLIVAGLSALIVVYEVSLLTGDSPFN